jgi:rod shape-determining protein MreD
VIFTPRIVAIVAALVFGSVLMQMGLFSQMPLLSSTANLVAVTVIALGLLGGAVPGTVSGFAAGLLLDSILGGTLGVWSLSLMAGGYLAGRWRETYGIVSVWVPPLLTGALCIVVAATYAAIQLMLGVEASVSLLVVREIVVQGILGLILALLFFPLIRRILRPALVDDPAAARSRSPRRNRRGILRIAR